MMYARWLQRFGRVFNCSSMVGVYGGGFARLGARGSVLVTFGVVVD